VLLGLNEYDVFLRLKECDEYFILLLLLLFKVVVVVILLLLDCIRDYDYIG
jgi:hypothetical protein